jgi:secreted PhoX family phosphatase
MSAKLNRRQFIRNSALALASVPFLGVMQSVLAAKPAAKEVPLPAGSTAALETDPVASAIGYKMDVKNVDSTRFPQRKKPDAKNQFCKSCALYTGVNDSWGKCQMITSGLVSSHGWCGSWSKKPA